MKKPVFSFELLIILVFFIVSKINAQSGWEQSASCNENANVQALWATGRENVIAATFKMNVQGNCTGTLINRNTSDGDLGFYFITARHCMSVDGQNNNNYIDFTKEWTFYFNYQSPDGDNNSTPESNRGISNAESFAPANPVTNGYEYLHRSRIRIVADYFWGDFALCKILTPLPPHFNVYFAGWNPSVFYSTQIGNAPPCNVANQYVGVHHPQGDIKKISGTNIIQSLETPIANGCYTITTVIDFLFGWIWGHSFSTQVICNYVDNPWYVVPSWCNGSIEEGSSGSGLFTGNNKLFGILSGNITGCVIQPTTYGKFRGNYYNAAVRNCLNPPNNWWIDNSGMDGRKITCYDNLTLPGVLGVSGEYFPANHYQQENHIELQASNNIKTEGHLRIYNGADYTFIAGNSITLNPGFHAEAGSHFLAKIGSCTQNKELEINTPSEILSETYEEMDFDISKYIDNKKEFVINAHFSAKIFPNPTNGIVSIEIFNENENGFTIELSDLSGRVLYQNQKFTNNETFNFSFLENGIYLVKIKQNDITQVKTIIKK